MDEPRGVGESARAGKAVASILTAEAWSGISSLTLSIHINFAGVFLQLIHYSTISMIRQKRF